MKKINVATVSKGLLLMAIFTLAILSINIFPALGNITADHITTAGASLMMAATVARPTQLEKILSVSNKFGANAATAQFTERVIYDQLPLDTRTEFRFFEGCNARIFPDTNLSENKLQKQENMVIKYISLQVTVFSAAFALPVVSTEPLSTTAANAGLYRGDLSIQVAQNQILKPYAIDDMKPEFNPFARHTAHNVIRLGVDLVIPELLEFVAILKTTSYVASTIRKLMLKLHGQATVFSPRANF